MIEDGGVVMYHYRAKQIAQQMADKYGVIFDGIREQSGFAFANPEFEMVVFKTKDMAEWCQGFQWALLSPLRDIDEQRFIKVLDEMIPERLEWWQNNE